MIEKNKDNNHNKINSSKISNINIILNKCNTSTSSENKNYTMDILSKYKI